jgi:chaperonin cofactor prefoldin
MSRPGLQAALPVSVGVVDHGGAVLPLLRRGAPLPCATAPLAFGPSAGAAQIVLAFGDGPRPTRVTVALPDAARDGCAISFVCEDGGALLALVEDLDGARSEVAVPWPATARALALDDPMPPAAELLAALAQDETGGPSLRRAALLTLPPAEVALAFAQLDPAAQERVLSCCEADPAFGPALARAWLPHLPPGLGPAVQRRIADLLSVASVRERERWLELSRQVPETLATVAVELANLEAALGETATAAGRAARAVEGLAQSRYEQDLRARQQRYARQRKEAADQLRKRLERIDKRLDDLRHFSKQIGNHPPLDRSHPEQRRLIRRVERLEALINDGKLMKLVERTYSDFDELFPKEAG